MSSETSAYIQNAWVGDDLQAATQWLKTATTGPFLTLNLAAPRSRLSQRSEPEPLAMKVALAPAEAMQLASLQQTSAGLGRKRRDSHL